MENIEHLIKEAKEGKQTAFTKLYNGHQAEVRRIVLSITKNKDVTDDIVSITFTKAFKNIQTFKKEVSFSMWLKSIATNSCIDFIRSTKTSSEKILVDSDSVTELNVSNHDDPEKEYILKERLISIKENINELSPRAREILTLRYVGELQYQQIADKLGVSIGTVKSIISMAKKKLFNPKKTSKNEKDYQGCRADEVFSTTDFSSDFGLFNHSKGSSSGS